MQIPDSFIEELLARCDITEVIGARVPLRKAGANFIARCPFHTEKTPSFSVNPNKQFYHCFGCHESGDAIQFLRKYEGLEFVEAVETLASRTGLTIPYETKSGEAFDENSHALRNAKNVRTKAVYAILAEAATFYKQQLRKHPAAPLAHAYLKQRGLTGETAKQFSLGYASAEWDGLLKHFGNEEKTQDLLMAAGLVIPKQQKSDFQGRSKPAGTAKHFVQENRFFDRFRNRIIFPIYDRRGRVVGFGGRLLEQKRLTKSDEVSEKTVEKQYRPFSKHPASSSMNFSTASVGARSSSTTNARVYHEPKYLNSPETLVFNKGSELYGLYEARVGHPSLTSLIVVEGYIDVVSLAQFGIHNAVGTLGTALTEKHIDVLFRQVSEIIFCFDGDKAGQEAAKRSLSLILPHMKEGRRVRFIRLPEGTDPDSFVHKFGQVAFVDLVERAIPLSDFLFESLSAHLDLTYLDSRAQLITLAKPLIELLPKGVFQQMLYDRLSQLAGVSAEIIQGKEGNPRRNSLSKPRTKFRALPPNPAKRALAMLLKDRGLLSRVASDSQFEIKFRSVDTEGTALFCVIIGFLREAPLLSIEALLEKLPEDLKSQFSYIELKTISDAIPLEGIDQEFLGALQRLRERAEDFVMESLLTMAKTSVLSAEDKLRLKDLLNQREKDNKSRLTE